MRARKRLWMAFTPAMRGSPGFSLMELLVVLAVVAALVSLLITALNSARARTEQVMCVNSLRQLHIGWLMYVEDNREKLPLNRSGPTSNLKLYGRANTTNSWVAGSPKEDVTDENIRRGSLYPYVKSTALYRCPSDKSKVVKNPDYRRTRSYSMSAYLNGDEAGADPAVKTLFSQLANYPPEKIFVFIGEDANSIWSGAFHVALKNRLQLSSNSWSSDPAKRHQLGANLSFVDGHIEYWRWADRREEPGGRRLPVRASSGQDVDRLQRVIPGP